MLPLLVGWFGAVAYWIGAGPTEDPAATADVAIVLGAAVHGDEPSPVFCERISHALDLYEAGRVGHLLFTGGRSAADALAESEAAGAVARDASVPADTILIETRSRTTMQNLRNAKAIMDLEGLETAIIVSDPLHMRRAMEMAETLGIAAQSSATPTTRYRSWRTKAPFLLREVYFMHHFWLFGE
ncbi:YdcF family protein [Aurantiacibacter aquimixticola]|uniref:YdcF family protein n=2 Tax=Aurantiacibacter aquimixticola TaxID=1958945 RepID=A0A419RWM5_9SPHN|nr:YdcF family protein [Aurantiacibacter aquimixticola]